MVSKFIPAKFQKKIDEPKPIQEFKGNLSMGLPFAIEHSAIAAVLDALQNTNAIDDRKMVLEQMMVILSRLPPGKLNTKLTHGAIELLYNDLPHPPLTNVGPEYAWRTADGSNNNICQPDLGKAGAAYARSVQQPHPLPRHMLPDPGLIFDTLLRREKFVQHPAGLSSLMFSFAALVVHTIFRTSHTNVNINETSSYVDLAPLYGVNQEAQNHVRVRDGRGLLHPDTFSEDRLLLLPPAVCVLLVLFNRNHNFIAKKLLEINERGTWKDPDSIPVETPNRTEILLQQEEEIFQTARCCNCGWFASIVFSDYFSAILGMVRYGSSWSLDPFSEFRKEDHSIFERGRGNICSVEFNCLYRWHATTSLEDEAWVNQLMSQTFPNKKPDDVSPEDFKKTLSVIQKTQPDVTHWTFGNLKRAEHGSFTDDALANILKNSIEHKAAAFGARGTPESMRWMEVMGIEANRRWGCCSLNEFRRYLGLKPYATFREWNPNPEVADAAEKLYGNIENLELYPGLQAEDTKPVIRGAGLCPGYTISRAILSDAIALVRGDRLFTADYTPHNLTAWGYNDCQKDPSGSGFGSMLGRLFLRTLPNQFTENSTYAWFPLMTPAAMDEILTNLEVKDQYDLSRPTSVPNAVDIKDYGAVSGVLANRKNFADPFLHRVNSIIEGPGFFLASDNDERAAREQQSILRALANTPEQFEATTKFFYETTKKLIQRHSYTLIGGKTNSIDIVRDVLKAVPIQWVATQVAGIELKDTPDDDGEYTAYELFEILDDVYSYFFDNVETSQVLALGNRVEKEVEKLLDQIDVGGSVFKRFSISGIVGSVSQFLTMSGKSEHQELAERLQQTGGDVDQLRNSVLAVMVGASVELAEVLTHMIDLLLEDPNIQTVLAGSAGAKDDATLEGYIAEVFRINPPVQGTYRHAKVAEAVGAASVAQEDLVYLDIATANLNERAITDPKEVDPKRSQTNVLSSDILTRTLGRPLVSKIMIAVLRAVLELGHVRRGPGQSGELKRFSAKINGIATWRYLDQKQVFTQWAQSLVIQYDAKPKA